MTGNRLDTIEAVTVPTKVSNTDNVTTWIRGAMLYMDKGRNHFKGSIGTPRAMLGIQ